MRHVATALFGVFLGQPLFAADGVIEINQARVAAGGVTPADAPDWPVTLGSLGSYRLTSDLVVPDENTLAILITASGVSLDLGGFSIAGPNSCPGGICTLTGTGIGISASVNDVNVGNGRVRGMGGSGISLLAGSGVENLNAVENGGAGITLDQGVVRNCTAVNNGSDGFRVPSGSLVSSTAHGNGNLGASLGTSVSFAGNTFEANAGGSVSGGHAIGGNLCSDRRCSTTGKRSFYLSRTTANGKNALGVCTAGFHMASLWELWDTSSLSYLFYDTNLAFTQADSGDGPPTFLGGWVRTGNASSTSSSEGIGNCAAWTDDGATPQGTRAFLTAPWDNTTPIRIQPWDTVNGSCLVSLSVWCVED